MPEININLWAVVVAALIDMAVGAFWYSPALFGSLWVKEMGFSKEKMFQLTKKDKMAQAYLLTFVTALVMSYVLAHFVDYTQATTFVSGMQTGFWIWLGFVATKSLSSVLWTGQSLKLYFVDIGNMLVALLLMGGILAVWA